MIGDIISILQGETHVTDLVSASNIFAIQRKQGTELPAVVVDLIDIKTNETKHLSSDLDFITIQVTAYADNPKESYDIADACRVELDNYVGTVNSTSYEVRFDDLETGLIPEGETFVTVGEYLVTAKRTSYSPHT